MIKFIFNYNKISIYSDEYVEEYKILRGRKENSDDFFIIVNPKTANMLYKAHKKTIRKDKLQKINILV